jgi:metal-responsive CopG/Arc/MetJ family transcriptional regulator
MDSVRETQRTAVTLDAELSRRLDDWRRRQGHIPTRTEALRQLLNIASRSTDSTAQ